MVINRKTAIAIVCSIFESNKDSPLWENLVLDYSKCTDEVKDVWLEPKVGLFVKCLGISEEEMCFKSIGDLPNGDTFKISKQDAISVFDGLTHQDDPFWEWAVEKWTEGDDYPCYEDVLEALNIDDGTPTQLNQIKDVVKRQFDRLNTGFDSDFIVGQVHHTLESDKEDLLKAYDIVNYMLGIFSKAK